MNHDKDKQKKIGKSQAVRNLQELILENLKKRYPSLKYPPIIKYTDQTSNGLTRCITDFLKASGHQAERINSTGRLVDNTKISTDVIGRQRTIGSVNWIKGTGRTGTADISATILGRSVKIEVKREATDNHSQSEDQKLYQKEVEAAGGIYYIARTFEGFMEWYNEFLKSFTS